MSVPSIAASGRAVAGVGALLRAARVVATGGLLAFGVWSAAPTLLPQLAATLAAPGTIGLSPAAFPSEATVPATSPKGPSTLSLSFSDTDLTRAAGAYFPATYAGVAVSAPSVRVTSGQIVLSASARTFLGTSALVANATPYVSDGKLLVRVGSATIGGIALPESARAQLSQQIQSAIDAQIAGRMRVTSVTASQGTVLVQGTALQ
jgi:hypothetical protein